MCRWSSAPARTPEENTKPVPIRGSGDRFQQKAPETEPDRKPLGDVEEIGVFLDRMKTMPLFVYGTLMPHGSNFGHIKDHVRASQPGRIEGVLIDLGGFPAMVSGRGIIRGVLLEIDEAGVDITDRIEVFRPGRRDCLYVRREVSVRVEGGEEAVAWTYEYANPERLAECPRLVVGYEGDLPIHEWPVGA